MRILGTFILLLLAVCVWARGLSEDSKKAVAGYNAIRHDASLPENQLYFIRCFPGDKDAFIKTFGPDTYDQLYPHYPEYLEAYKKFGVMYPAQSLPKAMNIAKGLVWSGGPVAELQNILLMLADNNPGLFVSELDSFNTKGQNAIILFMADMPGPSINPIFLSLLDKLGQSNHAKLKMRMEEIFEERQAYHRRQHGR